jgi:hypothetical protein
MFARDWKEGDIVRTSDDVLIKSVALGDRGWWCALATGHCLSIKGHTDLESLVVPPTYSQHPTTAYRIQKYGEFGSSI